MRFKRPYILVTNSVILTYSMSNMNTRSNSSFSAKSTGMPSLKPSPSIDDVLMAIDSLRSSQNQLITSQNALGEELKSLVRYDYWWIGEFAKQVLWAFHQSFCAWIKCHWYSIANYRLWYHTEVFSARQMQDQCCYYSWFIWTFLL